MTAREIALGVAFCLTCWVITIATALAVVATVDALTVPPEVRAHLT